MAEKKRGRPRLSGLIFLFTVIVTDSLSVFSGFTITIPLPFRGRGENSQR